MQLPERRVRSGGRRSRKKYLEKYFAGRIRRINFNVPKIKNRTS